MGDLFCFVVPFPYRWRLLPWIHRSPSRRGSGQGWDGDNEVPRWGPPGAVGFGCDGRGNARTCPQMPRPHPEDGMGFVRVLVTQCCTDYHRLKHQYLGGLSTAHKPTNPSNGRAQPLLPLPPITHPCHPFPSVLGMEKLTFLSAKPRGGRGHTPGCPTATLPSPTWFPISDHPQLFPPAVPILILFTPWILNPHLPITSPTNIYIKFQF